MLPTLKQTLYAAGGFILCATILGSAVDSRAQTKEKASSAPTQPTHEISGVPVVQETGVLTIDGQNLVLWGIDTLAPDQQCWQGNVAWFCGEQATIALRHFIEGRFLTCEIQQVPDGNPLLARCYRLKGAKRKDVSEMLVRHGWALDRGETSGGAYYEAEEEARKDKRGIWGSRFQTAHDWKEGLQRFINDPDHEQQPAEEEKDEDAPAEGE